MSSASTRAGRTRRTQRIVATGAWTPPAGVFEVDVLVVGGGGGGGGAYTLANVSWPACGAGGGGGWPFRSRVAVVPGTPVPVIIGSGGAGSAGTAAPTVGSAGTSSRFGDLLAPGGGGGASCSFRTTTNGNFTNTEGTQGSPSWVATGGSNGSYGTGGGAGYSGGAGGGNDNTANNTSVGGAYSAGRGRGGLAGSPGVGIGFYGEGGGSLLRLVSERNNFGQGLTNPSATFASPQSSPSTSPVIPWYPIGALAYDLGFSEYGAGGDSGGALAAQNSVTANGANGPANTGRGGDGAFAVMGNAATQIAAGGTGGSGLIIVTWEE